MESKLNFNSILLILIYLFIEPTFSQTNDVEDITIKRDSVLLYGKFFKASETEPLATIVLLNGFPGNENDVLGIGSSLSQKGINVLTFNYSGTYKSEGFFSFENTQKDIKTAFKFIHHSDNVTNYNIDTTNIFLCGYSYGGGMALTYAANHPEIKNVISIAGTDHGEFFREYRRNLDFKQMIDNMFDKLEKPLGPVRFPNKGKPKDITELDIAKADSTIDLRRAATLLVDKNILLIAGWEDDNVTVDNHILPLYRKLKKVGVENVNIIAFHDNHAFKKVRNELRDEIFSWIIKNL